MPRCLPALVLLVVALPICSHAQSLGEVAREVRAERQTSGDQPTRVITNDDLAKSPPSVDEASKTAAVDSTKPEAKPAESLKKDSARDREEREAELERHADAINQRYMERIATLRGQLNDAQAELVRLKKAEIDIANEYRKEVAPDTTGYVPPDATAYYNTQMRACISAIANLNGLITSLNAQLADVQEAARHAGVPHATD